MNLARFATEVLRVLRYLGGFCIDWGSNTSVGPSILPVMKVEPQRDVRTAENAEGTEGSMHHIPVTYCHAASATIARPMTGTMS